MVVAKIEERDMCREIGWNFHYERMEKMRNSAVCKYLLLLAVAVLLVLPAGAAQAAGVDWNEAKITVQGMGIAPPNAINYAHGRMLARRAAVADGYRQLAEAVQGVNVDAETTVENMMVTNDVVRTHVSAVIQGARVVSEAELPGGGYQVTMEIAIFGVSNSVAQAVLQRPAVIEPFPQPVASVPPAAPSVNVNINVTANVGAAPATAAVTTAPTAPTATTAAPAVSAAPVAPVAPAAPALPPAPVVAVSTVPTPIIPSAPAIPVPARPAVPSVQLPQPPVVSQGAIGGFTGLVVDCRGLGLKPVMSPVIKNAEGTPIYGHKNLDYDKVVEQGMAGYTDNPEKLSRAGSNPLVVKAVSLDNHNGNPVISVADANRVLLENGKAAFLDNLKVVFLR